MALQSSVLVRKGEARPSVSATAFTDPGIAWREKPAPEPAPRAPGPAIRITVPARDGAVHRCGVTVRLMPAEYVRLKTYAVANGRTLQDVLHTALALYLDSLSVEWPERRREARAEAAPREVRPKEGRGAASLLSLALGH